MLSTLNKISHAHNSCEDSIWVKEHEDYIIGVVADGCNTGHRSHFASQLLCYIVGSFFAVNKHHRIVSDGFLAWVVDDLRSIMRILRLEEINVLSTMLLFEYDKRSKCLKTRSLGDGVWFVNDVEHRIDQNNIPDYIGYHVNDDDLNPYLEKYPIRAFYDVTRFMVCSDGIERIERGSLQKPPAVDPIKLLFHPPASPNYLDRMWNLIKRDGWILADDLSIVSYAEDKN